MNRHTQPLTETSAGEERPGRDLPTALRAIAAKARKDPEHRFAGLYSLLNRMNLRAAYHDINPKAAVGVDRLSHFEYGEALENNVTELSEQLKTRRYHAQLKRRAYIPKDKNTRRPLGILTVSDKLVQRVAARILEAIYEQDFHGFSYAYRAGRDIREAVRAVSGGLMGSRCTWIVEADIAGFYDNIDHALMLRMLEKRIKDRSFLRLIGKWLRAGVLEKDGSIVHPATGTPQGGIISCVLANIYLHYALDKWFEKTFKPGCQGDAMMVRYADDFLLAFQYHADAARYYRALEQRLAKFGLRLAKEKSGVKLFIRHRKRESERFDFLGFEYRWGRSRKGLNMVKVRTSRRKLRKSIAAFKQWIREHRHKRIRWIFDHANSKLRGYYNYYGIGGNIESLGTLYKATVRLLYIWLNRRSERRSYTWKTFGQMLGQYRLEQPHIVWQMHEEQERLQLA